MHVYDAPLIGPLLRWMEDESVFMLPTFLWDVGRDFIFPLLITLLVLGGFVSILKSTWHWIVPPLPWHRHRKAKNLYRSGQVSVALKEWESLHTFGPAYLSRATHALYVQLDSQKALGILRVAKEQQVKIQLKQVEMIKLDAQVIQSGGNLAMIDMNARLAKQEHLGVTTW